MKRVYSEQWDLSTIPDDVWASELGRRSRAKAPRATNLKLEPCKHCKVLLSARQRRRKCPRCGKSQAEPNPGNFAHPDDYTRALRIYQGRD